MSDTRAQQLTEWANLAIEEIHPESAPNSGLITVSGDASFRRYFRLRAPSYSYIAVDAPPAHEDSKTFVRIARLFREAHVSAPKVIATDFVNGFMLLQDFGDTLYRGELNKAQAAGDFASADALYEAALQALVTLQARVDKKTLAPYSREKLLQEMALFEQWFCTAFLEMQLSDEERARIADAFQFLADAALAQTQVAVHRDYHSRNLLVLESAPGRMDASPGIIDFQDAVTGAYTYDLVSLLRDCYIRWEPDQLAHWLSRYHDLARAARIIDELPAAQLRRDFDLMGLQRHLKVMGIFARLAIRDHKTRYLADIPLVIRYFLEVSEQYAELASFHDWFVATVLPCARPRLKLEL
jgi:aminoglycoside/choline kinase family phosphotransferase